MADVNVTDGGIPKRSLTLQYQPLPNEPARNTPFVADGFEVKLYAESIKEVFKKEPQFQSVNKGPDQHFKGDKTLVVDTMKAKHTFEISAYVYAKGDQDDSRPGGKVIHSLPPFEKTVSQANADGEATLRNGDGKASITTDRIKVGDFDVAQPLGDTGIIPGSEDVKRVPVDGSETESLTEGADNDYTIDYDRGEITPRNNGSNDSNINFTEEKVKGPFGFIDLGNKTVFEDDLQVEYDFEVTARNIATMVRKMAQLGNPMVMRLDKREVTNDSGNKEEVSRQYLVTPKSVNIVSESETPDRYKLELELRKGETEI